MNVFIRVDSSITIGTGHLRRCLTLANALKEQGHNVNFICRDLKGNISQLVDRQGHYLHLLPAPKEEFLSQPNDIEYAKWLGVQWQQDSKETSKIMQNTGEQVDWLIVDSYALDYRWENSLGQDVKKIMVIDDLADREHDCDIFLDQNYYPNSNVHYNELIPFICRRFLGPKYAILRPEFLKERQNQRQRNGIVQCILVFFGGVDSSNETGKALKAIELLGMPDLKIDLIIGSSNPNRSDILNQCHNMPNVTCHEHVENMAQYMAKADLAIGAGGTTTWERCCMGLPSLILVLADNQTIIAEGIENANAGYNCGISQDITPESLTENLRGLMASKIQLFDYSKAASNLVDGKGASRIARAMQLEKIQFRKAEQSDCELLWHWANDPKVRKASFNSIPISWEDHTQWFAIKLKGSECYIFIAENEKGTPIGQIRFEINNYTASIGYSVQHDYRGLGFGETILREGIQKIVGYMEQPITFQGKVKPENIASQTIFKKVGFLEVNNENYQVWFELKR